jgi:ATP-binding cassette, subfamily B, bacterial
VALFRRIFEYLDLKPAIVEKPDARDLVDPVGSIELRNVSFRYPGRPAADASDAPWALRNVSMRIEPGQLAAIVGPSGAGKTTVTYLVPRFYDVTEGAVLIDGQDVRDLTMASIARTIGIVTQEPYLFHGTIRDNIAYARPDATDAEIEAAARDANIHDRILSFPDGYATVTGERGYRLSGGEKQRLAIARVLLMNPRILILDEATSALDSETERLVQEAIERATQNRTTLAIAHRLSTIRSADVIFGIDGGRLVESGTHDELLADGRGLYARLHAEQIGGQIGGPVDSSLPTGRAPSG